MAQGYWQASGGAGGAVNRNYTAAQLASMAAAGTLEAGTLYEPNDVSPTILYVAITASQLDALGSQMAYSQLAAQSAVTISNSGLTTVATYSTLGWKYLLIQYKNLDADALAEFELAARAGSASDFVITHQSSSAAPTSDFTALDGVLLDCYTDTASADLGVLAASGNAWLRLNVAGTYEVRLRTKQQGAANGTADVYATLLA